MSIDGRRHYIVKAKENTHKVWALLHKRNALKTEGELEITKGARGEYRKYVYKFDDFTLYTYDEDDERYFFRWDSNDEFIGVEFEEIREVYFDTKCHLHIFTHTVNSRRQAIGKWLEKEGIYYYYLEGNEMSIDETNDIQGEFFKRDLISDMGWLYNSDDIVPTFNMPWKEWCNLSINDQVELCKKHGVGYELTKLNFDVPMIKNEDKKGVLEEPFKVTYFINDEDSVNKITSLMEKITTLKHDETIELNNFYIHCSANDLIFFYKTFVDENDLSTHPSQILSNSTKPNPFIIIINTIAITEDRPFKDYLDQEGIHYIEAQVIDETEQ